jgi:hypothetical protein
MRTLTVLACLVLLSVTFAGCSDDKERYPDGVASTSTSRSRSSTGSASSTSTGASDNGTNLAPLANMTATPANGTAPVNVTFELSGSDPDGDPLNWTLTFGDGNRTNGTELPTTIVHEYKSKGNITAVFTVSDGQANGRARANLTIEGGTDVPAVPASQCDRTATAGQGGVYVLDGDGGTWTFVEDNDIPGLQVENNHPTEATGQAGTLGEHNALWEGCENGDQMTS